MEKGSGKCALRWHGWNEEWEQFCLLHSFWKRQEEQKKKHQCGSAFSVPELKGTINRGKSDRPSPPRPHAKNSYRVATQISQGWGALSHDFGVPTSVWESRSEETATFPGTTSIVPRSHTERRSSQSRNRALLPSGNLQNKALSMWSWEFLERGRPII